MLNLQGWAFFIALKSHFNTIKIIFKQTSFWVSVFFVLVGGIVNWAQKKGEHTARPNEIYLWLNEDNAYIVFGFWIIRTIREIIYTMQPQIGAIIVTFNPPQITAGDTSPIFCNTSNI